MPQQMLGECRERFAIMEEKVRQFEDVVKEIKDNHLPHIRSDIKTLAEDMRIQFKELTKQVSGRPSWGVMIALSTLLSFSTGLIVFLLTRGG